MTTTQIKGKKINPHKAKSSSKITITSTNLRGSNTGTYKESAKLHSFLDLTSDINIVIDSHLCKQKLTTLKKKYRQLFAKYTIHGNPSTNRGILVFLKKNNGCKITMKNSHGNNDTLFFTVELPDTITIDILAVYAPSKDLPKFWENAHEIMLSGNSQHQIIIGDYNCTLNHNTDQQGYLTDPHTKSRKVINDLQEQELFIDSFRHLNP